MRFLCAVSLWPHSTKSRVFLHPNSSVSKTHHTKWQEAMQYASEKFSLPPYVDLSKADDFPEVMIVEDVAGLVAGLSLQTPPSSAVSSGGPSVLMQPSPTRLVGSATLPSPTAAAALHPPPVSSLRKRASSGSRVQIQTQTQGAQVEKEKPPLPGERGGLTGKMVPNFSFYDDPMETDEFVELDDAVQEIQNFWNPDAWEDEEDVLLACEVMRICGGRLRSAAYAAGIEAQVRHKRQWSKFPDILTHKPDYKRYVGSIYKTMKEDLAAKRRRLESPDKSGTVDPQSASSAQATTSSSSSQAPVSAQHS